MDQKRRDHLLKTVRGRDVRRALKAIGELRDGADATLAAAVTAGRKPDEQREFQCRVARVVFARGIAGLVAEWPSLAAAPLRAHLMQEIEQFPYLWVDPALVDVALAALADPSRDVQVKAVWALASWVQPPGAGLAADTASARRHGQAVNAIRASVTPERRARITEGLVAMFERHALEPYPMLPQMVEALGHTAHSGDHAAIARLEALRSRSGEAWRVTHEEVRAPDYAWYEKLMLAKKGVSPEHMMRIRFTGTGLLDATLLEESLARIRSRRP